MGAEAIKTAVPVGGRTNSRGLYAQHHNNRMAVPGADRNRHAADRGPHILFYPVTNMAHAVSSCYFPFLGMANLLAEARGIQSIR